MSAIGVWRWHREIAVLALDEQRRSGHPEIDLEHVFLALVSSGGAVTDILAQHQISLDAARGAFEQAHRERIASLGISAAVLAEPRAIAGIHAGGFDWTTKANSAMQQAAQSSDPDRTLFALVLDEPSGRIQDALRLLGRDTGELHAALNRDETAGPAPESNGTERDWIRYRAYAPASVLEVWSLISDPAQWLAWNDFEHSDAKLNEQGVLVVRSAARSANGKPLKTPDGARYSEYVVSRIEDPRLIQWERSFPRFGDGRYRQMLRIELRAQGAGTQLELSMRQDHTRSVRKRAMRTILRPLYVVGIKGYLRGKSDGISRALRS